MKKLYIMLAIIVLITSGYSFCKLHEINKWLAELNNNCVKVLTQIEKANEQAKKELAKAAEKTVTSLGTFTITSYCKCEKCCGKWSNYPTASGTEPTEGRTIAVDPSIIAIGEKVIINGHTYTAEDTGGAIKGKRIDIYFDSHAEAEAYGKKKEEVTRYE